MIEEPVHVLAALGVAAAFLLVALSAMTIRAATLRGWPIGLAVAMAFPPFCVVTAPISVIAALLHAPAELKARGGGLLKSGAWGGLSVVAIVVGVIGVVASCGAAWLWAKAHDMTGEPMQAPMVVALLVGGL